MEIQPHEVESVKPLGKLFGDDVKLVKTQGGFNIAVGKKKKNSRKAEALAAGSHPAIVSHQIAQEFGSNFQPIVAKSEQDQLEKVEEKTEYLPRHVIERGVKLYTLSKNNNLEFILYKHGLTLGRYEGEKESDKFVIKKHEFNDKAFKPDKQTAEAFSRAIKDKMHEMNMSKVEKGRF